MAPAPGITFERPSAASATPVLVVLEPGAFNYPGAAAGGADLRLGTDPGPNNGFEAPHWVERWDPGGRSYVWVRVPSASAGSNTIHVFYGFSGAAAPDVGDFAAVFADTLRTTGDRALGGDLTNTASVSARGGAGGAFGGADTGRPARAARCTRPAGARRRSRPRPSRRGCGSLGDAWATPHPQGSGRCR